jgi:flagellar assembly factor FliW
MNTTAELQTTPLEVACLRIKTRFGEFESDTRNVLNFPVGLPGFEKCHGFVMLSSTQMAPVQCLHAIDGPPASFLVVDPRLVLPDYRTQLTAPDRERLGADADSSLLWLAIVTIQEDGQTTANLRAPLVINPARMVGFQVMPYDSLYPVRHPL